MKRKDILKDSGYWVTQMQLALYDCAAKFMHKEQMNRTQLAAHLGVTKGYVTQLLNGDYDHKLSKFVELSLAFGYVPKIDFIPIGRYYMEDGFKTDENRWKECDYQPVETKFTRGKCSIAQYSSISETSKSAA